MKTIALWLLDLDLPRERLASLEPSLDADEHARAARFQFPRDRNRFIARRGQLRQVLGANGAGGAIRYVHNAYGKPALADHPDLRFSLSHSAGIALCAVAHGIDIGCDIEKRDPDLADPTVAKHLFAPAEYRALMALPPKRRVEGFFACWTRKEAFIKAIGLGVSHPLDSFAVTLGDPARIVSGGEGWSIASFETAPGFAAALVAQGDAAVSMKPPRWFSAGAAPAAPGAS